MITYKDIKKAINTLLINEFGYEINSNDVKEGFIRPSFFVEFDNVNRSATEEQTMRNLTISIYFFPTDRVNYSLEVLDVTERLENLFDLKLSVLDRKFNIDEVTSNVADGVLVFEFDIQYQEGKVLPDAELMQELDYKGTKE